MQRDGSVLALATIRNNRGISLKQIADSTKISVRSLEAIENGEYQKLPGGIYNTSYIRQYARAIDYDEGELLAAYHRVMGSGTPGQSPHDSHDGKNLFGGYRPAPTAF